MNCANWEERIALYMGDDLGPAEAAQVERHLAECAGCQVFASGMRESLALLREAHGEEPGAAAYAAVRARVIGELERRPMRRWFFGLAAVAVTAALLAAVWMRPAKHVEQAHREAPQPQREVVIPQPETAIVPVRTPGPRSRVQRAETPAVKPVVADKPLVVKLVTDDPDVVIYWITDTKGE
jgi:anti-sigma factor RsiW